MAVLAQVLGRQWRKFLALIVAVSLLSTQLFYSVKVVRSYNDNDKAGDRSFQAPRTATETGDSSFEAPQVTTETLNEDNKNTIEVGKEYSAKACWLDPAWGMGKSLTVACSSNSSVYNTSATQLTCGDDKPSHVPRTQKAGVTIALLYFAKPAMLMRQLETFENYPLAIRKRLTILIVDDGSPDGLRAADYISSTRLQSTSLRLRLAHITTDKAWNIGGARNLAFYLTDTPQVLLLDLDTLVPQETIQYALGWTTRNQTHIIAHRFNRRLPTGETRKHPAVCFIDTDAYWESGGCDEDFCGNYGFTDVHFWWRWKKDTARLLLDHTQAFIVEFADGACNSTYIPSGEKQLQCEQARQALNKPKRNSQVNKPKLKQKMHTGCWSNRFLRFQWVLVKS